MARGLTPSLRARRSALEPLYSLRSSRASSLSSAASNGCVPSSPIGALPEGASPITPVPLGPDRGALTLVVTPHSAAEGPDDESGDAARAPSGAALLEADVHPIKAFAESAAALSLRRGESESSTSAWIRAKQSSGGA